MIQLHRLDEDFKMASGEQHKDKKGKAAFGKGRKSFAQKHWRDFEELSLQIIHSRYQEQPGEVFELTSGQNDGGYDGIICFSSQKYNAAELYKVLLEAKLRSVENQDLPLSDFSKTIIVAINTIADKVYISTNTYFSEETNHRLQTFSRRTGLDIRTLDIEDISNWLNKHPDEAQRFKDQALIKKLIAAPCRLKQSYKTLSITQEKVRDQTETLIGRERNALCQCLAQRLTAQNGLLCIQGSIGSGKSVFIDNLASKLQQSYPNTALLDLTRFSDARGVFIKLLAFAWGESTSSIYGMSNKDLEEVTQYLGNDQFPSRSRSALLHMIHQSQEEFDENQTLHSELLLDYLKQIVPPVLRRVRSLVIVRNVKAATVNALDFLDSFVRILSGQRISFLIELEEQQKNCEYFSQRLKQAPEYVETVSLPPWDSIAARQFLAVKAPELSEREQSHLIRYFGLLPLSLSVGTEIFCQSEFGKTVQQISAVIPKHATPGFQYSLGHIDYLVEQFAAAGGTGVQCGLVLLGLFDGVAEAEFIEQTAISLNCTLPLAAFHMCPFIKYTAGQFQVRHGTYMESIRKFSFVTKTFLFQILSEIEPTLERHFQDTEYIDRKRFEILCLSRDFERLRDLWIRLVRSHRQRGERQLEYEALKKVYEWWMENPIANRLTPYEQYFLLRHLTETAYALFGAYEEELDHYFDQLDVLINLTDASQWPDGERMERRLKAEILNTKCQVALGRAEYRQMLSYAEEGIALIQMDETPESRNWLGALWADKALALKHLENISVCIRFLESGKELLDGIRPFCYCYYIHLSSLYSVKEPRKALEYFELIQSKYTNSLAEDLHIEHNIATMHFVLGEYACALEISGQVWLKAYENHVPIEEGRSDHLLGCIAWVNGETEQAYERFKAACSLFQRHVHNTHLWPPLINLALLCMETDRTDEALKYAGDAAEFLLEYHLDSINHIDVSASAAPLPKLFVGILLLLDCIERLNKKSPAIEKLLRSVTNKEIHEAYRQYVVPHTLDNLLKGSGYICGGKRMLKV